MVVKKKHFSSRDNDYVIGLIVFDGCPFVLSSVVLL